MQRMSAWLLLVIALPLGRYTPRFEEVVLSDLSLRNEAQILIVCEERSCVKIFTTKKSYQSVATTRPILEQLLTLAANISAQPIGNGTFAKPRTAELRHSASKQTCVDTTEMYISKKGLGYVAIPRVASLSAVNTILQDT